MPAVSLKIRQYRLLLPAACVLTMVGCQSAQTHQYTIHEPTTDAYVSAVDASDMYAEDTVARIAFTPEYLAACLLDSSLAVVEAQQGF